jgi:hypothetical protein
MAGVGSKPGERRGGRKKGVPNKKTAELINRAAAKGVMPFDVLIENMHYYRRKAAAAEKAKRDDDALRYRALADEAAAKAAPYAHPRLSAVQMSGGLQISHEEALKQLK